MRHDLTEVRACLRRLQTSLHLLERAHSAIRMEVAAMRDSLAQAPGAATPAGDMSDAVKMDQPSAPAHGAGDKEDRNEQ